MPIIKKQIVVTSVEDVEKWELSYIAGRNVKWHTTLEKFAVCWKVKHKLNI